MNFSTDGGGFAFSCDDLKLSIDASTWATRLSQLGRMTGTAYIATGLLPNPEYISKILGKRPRDIFIVADIRARDDAQSLKRTFPSIRIALHPACNAKIVLIEPLTVWVSSADFGESLKTESAIGLHSAEAFKKAVDSLFSRLWQEASEIL